MIGAWAPGLGLLRRLNPERAHELSLTALRSGVVGGSGAVTSPRLGTTLAGLALTNPVGLAAGYDKNARALPALMRAGFGFLEAGAVTPRPQPGNPPPRVFRLAPDRAVINRLGFNNDGMEAVARRLVGVRRRVPVGLNLGAGRDSPDRATDYARVLERTGPHLDFATINVSSPNTAGLRDLQSGEALAPLLARVTEARDALPHRIPLFLKVAPDLAAGALDEVGGIAREAGIDGLVATNTTRARPDLAAPEADQDGGLSGPPLRDMATRTVARLSRATDGKLAIIGVGGVDSGAAAFDKIAAGASAVQLYTAMIYDGPRVAAEIARELDAILAAKGLASVADAVATERARWL